MPRLLLCANPAASGFTGGLHRDILGLLRDGFEVESEWPKTPADTRALSAEAAADGVEVVAAMGGDGVVHHVASGIAGTETALAIIPAGTTNVLGRLLRVPAKPKKAAQLICGDSVRTRAPSAALRLTDPDTGHVEERLATFAIGVGFDADVVEVAEREPYRKNRFGGVHYARTALSVIWGQERDRPVTLEVAHGDRTTAAAAVMIQLHDRYTYFGRLPLSLGPHEPGTATVLVARELPRRRIAPILLRTAAGRDLSEVEGIEVWTGVNRLTIASDGDPLLAQADGELLGAPERMDVDVSADRLWVLTPR